MRTLILIALIAFIYCDGHDDDGIEIESDTYFVCPDDKIQLKDDVCAIYEYSVNETYVEYQNRGGNFQNSKNLDSYFYIKKKCGKNEKCREAGYSNWKQTVDTANAKTTTEPDNSNCHNEYDQSSGQSQWVCPDVKVTRTPVTFLKQKLYKCQNTKVSLKKEGKKCAYNLECLTGYCSSKECKTVDKCINNEQCGKGKYCDVKEKHESELDDGTTGTCKNRVTSAGSECDATLNFEDCCANGLFLVKSTTAGKYKCIKPFSLEVGDDCSDQDDDDDAMPLCKSGFCINVGTNGKQDYQCVSVASFDSKTCAAVLESKAGAKFDIDGDENSYKDKDDKTVCIWSQGRLDLLEDIRDRYDKIKIDKLNDKEDYNYAYREYFGDKKFAELYAVYQYYPYLLNQGLIKDDGKRNGDKKCEYEFWKSTISSSYVNVYLGFILALLGLLF